jgi:hypothetical protein
LNESTGKCEKQQQEQLVPDALQNQLGEQQSPPGVVQQPPTGVVQLQQPRCLDGAGKVEDCPGKSIENTTAPAISGSGIYNPNHVGLTADGDCPNGKADNGVCCPDGFHAGEEKSPVRKNV